MKEGRIIGIECSLYGGGIKDILDFLSQKSFLFNIRWCTGIADKSTLLPKSFGSGIISALNLRSISRHCIWELVLDIYPPDGCVQKIETYEDYSNSSCICCLIYYDCGLLDIFIKDTNLHKEIYNLLLSLGAENVEQVTDNTIFRTLLTL